MSVTESFATGHAAVAWSIDQLGAVDGPKDEME
jgi:hypothetical protein